MHAPAHLTLNYRVISFFQVARPSMNSQLTKLFCLSMKTACFLRHDHVKTQDRKAICCHVKHWGTRERREPSSLEELIGLPHGCALCTPPTSCLRHSEADIKSLVKREWRGLLPSSLPFVHACTQMAWSLRLEECNKPRNHHRSGYKPTDFQTGPRGHQKEHKVTDR